MKGYVLIHVADSVFAVEAELVLEILEMPWLSRCPGSPDSVLGLVDYRGSPVPVLDLSKRLGGPASCPGIHSQLLFFNSPKGMAALLVEGNCELVTVGERVAPILDLSRLIDFCFDPVPDSQPPPDFAAAFSPEERAILRARARSLAQKTEHGSNRKTLNVVIVRLGQERFALDVTGVAELVRNSPVTPLPGGPPHLLGLIYHRGGLLRLVDIRPQLGLPVPSQQMSEVVVLNGEGMLTGIAVDAVEAVVALDPDDFQSHRLTLLEPERLQVGAF
ncbi:MAG: chemotaxis protein CheW [Candidatus Eremiobacteraeota bacterium]|nr:chemotaxis protein CheW [Candidatus Eremiobacteraeota bacterium]MCW5868125.1 chemotaxis protein CheW [Candidatus Eremiobacteraeota bacterium]